MNELKEDEERKNGPVGLIVGLSVFAVLVSAGVSVFLIYRKRNKNRVKIHTSLQLNNNLFEMSQRFLHDDAGKGSQKIRRRSDWRN